MRDDIRVSFKNNPEEDQLYDEIIEASKYIGKAIWLKIAAREKLERDKMKNVQMNPMFQFQNTQKKNIINSIDDLFQ